MTLANVQNGQKKDTLPAKYDEEIPGNKICVNIILTYLIRRKGQKENLNLKAVMAINPVP